MYLHITPQFFTSRTGQPACELVRLEVPELGVALRGDVDFKTLSPFPNKRFRVGAPVARKHYAGLLFEVDRLPPIVSYLATWAVNADRLVTHQVILERADEEHDLVSDCISSWASHLGRRPPLPEGLSIACAQPRMDFDAEGALRRGAKDTLRDGIVSHREEVLRVPGIPFATFSRLGLADKVPGIAQAIRVQDR